MAPAIYSFEGIKIYIYDKDHNPVHFHAQYQSFESIYNLIIENNKLISITTRNSEYPPLPPAQDKKVRKFVKRHWRQIMDKWVQIVIYGKRITLTRISGL